MPIIYELSIQKLFNQYFKPVSRSNLQELYQKVFLYLEFIYLNSILTVYFTLIEKDHLGDRSPEKDCC